MKIQPVLLLLAASLLYLIPAGLQAQPTSDESDVKQTIVQLFDGMRTSDSSMVSTAFTPDAIMQTIGKNEEGMTIVHNGSLEGFLKAVGTPKKIIWDEQISSYEIKIDGELASVWTPYKFFAGENFSHCGVNSFQLAKFEESWKIFHIVDTRRTTNCGE
ncbi:MAG: nuclear transport factor 2 family protein [Balneolaceae bacterium]